MLAQIPSIRLDHRHFVGEPSIIVFKEGDLTCALDVKTKALIVQSRDASEVIQRAIDYVVANGTVIKNEKNEYEMVGGGGRILIKRGEYVLRAGLNFSNAYNIDFEGEGRSTVLKLDDGVNDSIIKDLKDKANTRARNTIRNLLLDGNRRNNERGCGIHIRYSSDNIIEDCEIRRFAEDGIYLEPIGDKTCENNKLFHLDIKECKVGVHFNARDNRIIDSYIYHCDSDGVVVEAGAGSSQILLCGIYGNGGNGINVKGIKGPPEIWHVEIYGCSIDYNGKHGIVMTDDVKYTTILANRLFRNSRESPGTYDGINITHPQNGWSSHIIIIGNRIYDGHRYGIYFDLHPNSEPSFVGLNFCKENYVLLGPVYDVANDPGPGRRTRLLVETGSASEPTYSFKALPNTGFYATTDPLEVKASVNGVLRMAIGTSEARFDVHVRPMLDNARDLGSPTSRWKQGWFSDIVVIRKDTGDYGGNFANYTPPTGYEGALLVAEDTNATAPGRRLYVYCGGKWRYVNLSG